MNINPVTPITSIVEKNYQIRVEFLMNLIEKFFNDAHEQSIELYTYFLLFRVIKNVFAS